MSALEDYDKHGNQISILHILEIDGYVREMSRVLHPIIIPIEINQTIYPFYYHVSIIIIVIMRYTSQT